VQGHGACRQCDPRWQVIAASSALGEYDGPLRDILHALKYARRTSIAGAVACELREAARDVLDGADAVVPVPLHPLRSWRRGFNQARLIAGGLGLPVVDALVRRRATRRQASLTRDDRWSNLHAVIGVRARTAQRLRGATVVVVDDVVTTGATVTACARALREAGVAEVRVATAARAVRRSRR
jgi:ComF family protein